LNNTGKEELNDGRFPRYQRWRLEAGEPVTHGSFLIALGLHYGEAQYHHGAVHLPSGGHIHLGGAGAAVLGVECDCDCLLWDDEAQRLTAIGLRRLRHGSSELTFSLPVDMTYKPNEGDGTLYAQESADPTKAVGFQVWPWAPIGEECWKTLNTLRTVFTKSQTRTTATGGKHER
jgi:hypothetical protein